MRNPTPSEVSRFGGVLRLIKAYMKPARIVAVGMRASAELGALGEEHVYVRHPSRGGQAEFAAGMRELLRRGSEARSVELESTPREPVTTTPRLAPHGPCQEELLEVAEDCPVDHAVVPPDDKPQKTRARIAYEVLSEWPYRCSEIDFFRELDVVRRNGPNAKIGSYQIKRSPLVQSFGWGIHRNSQGKLALVAMESAKYRELQRTVKRTKAYRKSKA